VVIGAGVAGLVATAVLTQAGVYTQCLEARDRVGGRVFTIHDPLAPLPAELGAEFIHGRPPEIWDLITREGLAVRERNGRFVHMERGQVQSEEHAGESMHRLFSDLEAEAARGPDRTFAEFLDRSSYSDAVKLRATGYVEGFNAARKEIIGIASLAQDAQAADRIDGDRSFTLLDGYDSVVSSLIRGIQGGNEVIRLNSVVETVEWKPGSATVHIRSRIDGRRETFRCAQVIVTVPLGVLQASPDNDGAIRFDPEPADSLSTARSLAFGHAVRVTLRFDTAFWEQNDAPSGVGFIYSHTPLFPTWWTQASMITGWSAGPAADGLLGRPGPEIIAQSVAALEQILGRKAPEVRAAYFHDWSGDPFSRGAYSYVPAEQIPARQRLAQPVCQTLYFAGEATNLSGHGSTVHGAIESGRRAAQQIIGGARTR
jgi:monoamine oxidase